MTCLRSEPSPDFFFEVCGTALLKMGDKAIPVTRTRRTRSWLLGDPINSGVEVEIYIVECETVLHIRRVCSAGTHEILQLCEDVCVILKTVADEAVLSSIWEKANET